MNVPLIHYLIDMGCDFNIFVNFVGGFVNNRKERVMQVVMKQNQQQSELMFYLLRHKRLNKEGFYFIYFE